MPVRLSVVSWFLDRLGLRRRSRHPRQRRITSTPTFHRAQTLEQRQLLSGTVINVTTLADTVNAGDGVTSLREAIIQANTTAGDFIIELQSGTYFLTLSTGTPENNSASGDLDILNKGKVTVMGTGSGSTVLHAGGSTELGVPELGDRVLHVLNGATLEVRGVTITGGDPLIGSSGGLKRGGGILNEGGSVTLTATTVKENSAFQGGGIYSSSGTLTINNSTITKNTATDGAGLFTFGTGTRTITGSMIVENQGAPDGSRGGGLFNGSGGTTNLIDTCVNGNTVTAFGLGAGGGIYNEGSLTLLTSTVSGNQALNGGSGGGIYNTASLTVTGSTISNNASASGGGFFNSSTDTVTIAGSTFYANQSATDGGGILNSSVLSISNSTFSGNLANGNGGAIHSSGGGSQLTVTHSTIVLNRSDVERNGTGEGGGIFNSSTSTVGHTIIAGNLKGTATETGTGTVVDDIEGTVSGSFNLVGNADTSGGLTNGINGNIVGDNGAGTRLLHTILHPLLDENGGRTLTHVLLKTSVAVNAGNVSITSPPTLDQRGLARINGTIDIGAVEYHPLPESIALGDPYAVLSRDEFPPGWTAKFLTGIFLKNGGDSTRLTGEHANWFQIRQGVFLDVVNQGDLPLPAVLNVTIQSYDFYDPQQKTLEEFHYQLRIVDLGKPEAKAIDALVNLQLPSTDPLLDGAFRVGTHQSRGVANTWISSYFGQYTSIALLEAYQTTGDTFYRDAVKRWLTWTSQSTGLTQAERDILLPGQGDPALPDRRLFFDYVWNDGSDQMEFKGPDAVDSAAAMYLLAVSRYIAAEGTFDAATELQVKAAAHEALAALARLADDDGLVYALYPPIASNHHSVKFLGDNLEVAGSLREAVALFNVWGDTARSQQANLLARNIAIGLDKYDNPGADWFYWALDQQENPSNEFTTAYPAAWANLWVLHAAPFLANANALWTQLDNGFNPITINFNVNPPMKPEGYAAANNGLELWALAAAELGDPSSYNSLRSQLEMEMLEWSVNFEYSIRHALGLIALLNAQSGLMDVGAPGTYANAAPEIDVASDTLTFSEGYDPVIIATAVTITDADDSQIAQAVISIGNYVSGEDVLALSGSLPTGITAGTFNITNGTLTLSGLASLASYQTALAQITYQNTNTTNPNTTTRTFTFTITDGNSEGMGVGAQTASDTHSISIQPLNNAPGIDVTNSTLTFNEGIGAVVISPAVTITDVDDSQIAQAVISIGNYVSGEDVLALSGSLPPGINAGVFNTTNGTLTLTGLASLASYQTALAQITYQNTNTTNPNTTTRTFTFTITDGNSAGTGGGALTAFDTRNISIQSGNDAPGIDVASDTLTFSEGYDPVIIATAVTITDADDSQIAQAVISIGNYVSGEDVLAVSGSLPTGITAGTFNITNGTLTLSGLASLASYQTALAQITYQNTNTTNPNTTTRTFTFTITDGNSAGTGGGALIASDTRNVSIQPGNDAPGIDVTNGTLTYAIGSGAVTVAPSVTITDVDDTQIAQAVISIGNYVSGEDVLAVSGSLPAGISAGAFNTTNGTLTLSGLASLASYQTALAQITYQNTNTTNPATTRTITFTITDGNSAGSGALTAFDTRNISIQAANEAPAIVVNSPAPVYYTGDRPIAVANSVTITDVDDTLLTQAVIAISNYVSGEEELSLNGTLPAGITTTGFNALTGTLTLTLTGSASLASYQTALSLVTWRTFNYLVPTNGTKEIQISVTDSNASGQGDGAETATVTREILVRSGLAGDSDIIGQRTDTGEWYAADPGDIGNQPDRVGQWPTTTTWRETLVGDFDGDGTDDIARRAGNDWWVSLTTDGEPVHQHWGSWLPGTWTNVVAGDFNDDGYADIAGRLGTAWYVSTSDGSRFTTTFWGGWAGTWTNVVTGNFGGDNSTDIAGRVGNTWYVAISSGSGFVTSHWGGWGSGTWTNILTGDFTGNDGLLDIAARRGTTWALLRSNGDGFDLLQNWGTWGSGTWSNFASGDFNQDGMADLVGRRGTSWWVAFSNGDTLGQSSARITNTPSGTWQNAMTGDFNSDGYADLISRRGNVWYVYLANQSGGFLAPFTQNWGSGTFTDIRLGNFNGDGNTDVIGRAGAAWTVSLSAEDAFEARRNWGLWNGQTWSNISTGDFNYDGKADLLARSGSAWWVSLATDDGFVYQRWTVWGSGTWTNPLTGDFNGDGMTDLAARNGSNWFIWLSTGDSFQAPVAPAVGGWTGTWINVLTGDFNRDGMTDIAGQRGNTWYVYLSTGTGLQNSAAYRRTLPSGTWSTVKAGDFTGDGRTDIAVRKGNAWYMFVADETSLRPLSLPWSTWPAGTWQNISTGDFNGDGRLDLLARTGNTWYAWQSTGDGFAPYILGTWPSGSWQDVVVGDYNGDGRSDFAARQGSVWSYFFSDQTFFNAPHANLSWLPASWTNIRTGNFH